MLEYASIRFTFDCSIPTTVPRIIVATAITQSAGTHIALSEPKAAMKTRTKATKAAAATMLCTGGAWTAAHPSPAVIAAYEREPALAAWRIGFDAILRELIGVLLEGLLARQE